MNNKYFFESLLQMEKGIILEVADWLSANAIHGSNINFGIIYHLLPSWKLNNHRIVSILSHKKNAYELLSTKFETIPFFGNAAPHFICYSL
jgi:hypothetical protein